MFRQWRATSHCNKLHGYAIKIEIVFESALDDRNWVVDFGELKSIKDFLAGTFDHTLIIADDDPQREVMMLLHAAQLAQVVVLPAVGCEKFAEHIFRYVESIPAYRDKILSVQVWEHESNSAKVIRKTRSSVHIPIADGSSREYSVQEIR